MLVEFLKNATIYENTTPSQVSAYVRQHVGMHELHASEASGRAMLRHANVGELGLSMISYGDWATVANLQGIDSYHFQMTLAGTCTITLDDGDMVLPAGCAAVISPSLPSAVHYSPDCIKVIVRIPKPLFHACALDGFGRVPDEGVRFGASPLDLGSDLAAFRAIELLFLEADRQPASPRMQRPLELVFASKLLDVFPNNTSSVALAVDAGDFLNVIDRYIEAHIREDIGAVQLAAELGISERTFYNKFHAHTGMPPSHYIKDRRLRHVYALLSHPAGAAASVTDLAFEFGFNHLGRFSADYRTTFGELPSDTQRRRRAAIAN
jgi:AraC-like DNA-binding protein